MKNALLLNSLVWAGVILATAVVLQGTDSFVTMLIVLLMGSVASDAILAAPAAPGQPTSES